MIVSRPGYDNSCSWNDGVNTETASFFSVSQTKIAVKGKEGNKASRFYFIEDSQEK